MAEVPTLEHFYREDYAPLKLRGRRERTFALYETTLRTFRRYLGREPLLSDLTDDCVTRYLAWYRRDGKGHTPASVNKEHANITAIWRFAFLRHQVTNWPTVQREPEPEREPQAWLEAEIKRIFDAASHEPGVVGKIPAGDWWKALLLTVWDSAERIGAVMSLRWSDVDLVNGWILFPADARKGGKRDNLSRISPETIAALRAIKKSPGLVFRWPYTKTYLWNRLARIEKKAGLECGARDKFHRIRRTVASYFEAAGGNATELLGHQQRKTTEKSYLDKRIVRREAACEKIFRLDGKTA